MQKMDGIPTTLSIDPDKVLRGAEGQVGLVLVLGWDLEGELYAAASEGNEESLVYLIERFKHDLLSDKFKSGSAAPLRT
jgi:hypothetical protein